MHDTTRELIATAADNKAEKRYRYRVAEVTLTTRDDKGVVRMLQRSRKPASDRQWLPVVASGCSTSHATTPHLRKL